MPTVTKKKQHCRASAVLGSEAAKRKRQENKEHDREARNLKRTKGELIPKDAVRAILHTLLKLTAPEAKGGEELDRGAAISRAADLLGYNRETVSLKFKRWQESGKNEIPVDDGSTRGAASNPTRCRRSVETAQHEIVVNAKCTCKCSCRSSVLGEAMNSDG